MNTQLPEIMTITEIVFTFVYPDHLSINWLRMVRSLAKRLAGIGGFRKEAIDRWLEQMPGIPKNEQNLRKETIPNKL